MERKIDSNKKKDYINNKKMFFIKKYFNFWKLIKNENKEKKFRKSVAQFMAEKNLKRFFFNYFSLY